MQGWSAASDGLEEACRQEDDGADEVKDAAHGDADHTKWQQEQPDDGIEHEGQQGERPANYEQNAPKKEFCHRLMRLVRAECFIHCYADVGQ